MVASIRLSSVPRPCLYAGDFNCPHIDWGYNNSSVDGESLLAWANSNNLALLHNRKDEPSFHSGRWNTDTNPDLAYTRVGPDSCLTYKHALKKLSWSQHQPSLITPPRFFFFCARKACQAMELVGRSIGATITPPCKELTID